MITGQTTILPHPKEVAACLMAVFKYLEGCFPNVETPQAPAQRQTIKLRAPTSIAIQTPTNSQGFTRDPASNNRTNPKWR
jgi:hypothetical protein